MVGLAAYVPAAPSSADREFPTRPLVSTVRDPDMSCPGFRKKASSAQAKTDVSGNDRAVPVRQAIHAQPAGAYADGGNCAPDGTRVIWGVSRPPAGLRRVLVAQRDCAGCARGWRAGCARG